MEIVGGKDSNFHIGPQAPFTNKNASEERKCWEKPHSRWSYREMLKGTSSRGSSSSDIMNVSQVNFALT